MTNSPAPVRRAIQAARALGLLLGLSLAVAPAEAQPRQPRVAAPKKGKLKRPAIPTPPAPAKVAPVKPAEAKEGAAPLALDLDLPVERHQLDNGLRVVIHVDRTSPTVAIAVVYDVGSRDEERGRSGFAHLFEHLMFQGSKNVAKGDHSRLISAHGGALDSATGADRTSFSEVLPASELALGLWLEADRMRSLDLHQDSFDAQRKVVEDEHRRRVSGAAYQPSSLRLEELVYQGYWPYEHPTLGSMADLHAAKIDSVRDFHARHYGPNTAVLSIAGDVDAADALLLVRQYFDGIPRIKAAPFVDASLPEQTSQRTGVIKDDHARTPGVLYGFAIPGARHPDHHALQLAGIILADGQSSRLHQLLVRDRALVQRVSAGASSRRGPGLFRVDAVLTDGAKVADVERIIEAEIKSLATRGPSDAEVQKARRRVETGVVLGLQSNLTRARRLGEEELTWGDANQLRGELGRYFAVKKADIQRAVSEHLGPTRRTLIETVPTPREGGEAAPPAAAAKKAAAPAPRSPKAAKKPAPRPRKKKP